MKEDEGRPFTSALKRDPESPNVDVGMAGGDLHLTQRTPASSAHMMNAARNMWGRTWPSPGRLAVERTHPSAVRR